MSEVSKPDMTKRYSDVSALTTMIPTYKGKYESKNLPAVVEFPDDENKHRPEFQLMD